jgi:predicted outer membrane protein
MKPRSLAIALALAIVPQIGAAQATMDSGDAQIVSYFHLVNQIEIEVGNLAKRNGTSPMREFGGTLVADHTYADKRLVAFAQTHGMATIPVEAPIDPDHRPVADAIDHLKTLRGSDFDDAFLDVVPDAQDAEVQNIEDAIATVDDPALEQILRDFEYVMKSHVITVGNLQR